MPVAVTLTGEPEYVTVVFGTAIVTRAGVIVSAVAFAVAWTNV